MKEKNKENKTNLIKKTNDFIQKADDKISNSKFQRVSVKMYEVLKKIILLFIIVFLVILAVKAFYKTGYFKSTYDYALEKTEYKYDNIFENLVYIIVMLTIIYVFQKILEKVKLKYVIPLGILIIFGIFVWFVLTLDLIPIADQGQLIILGEKIYKNHLFLNFTPDNYLAMFPYQYGIALYIGVVIEFVEKFNNFLNLEYYAYLQIVNCICSIFSMVLLYLIGNRMFDDNVRAKKILIILIMLFGFYFMFFNTHVYGNIPGLMFALFAFLCTIRYVQNGKLYNLIAGGISIFVAYYLKTNYQIFLIGMIVILFFNILKKIEIKKFIGIVALLVMFTLPKNLGDMIFTQMIGQDIPKGVPMLTYIYMGWAPTNTLSPGWYTGDVIEIFNRNEYDHDRAKEETRILIQKRIEEFSSDKLGFLNYALDKLDSTWINPTFQTIWTATPGEERIKENEKYNKYLNEMPWLINMLNHDSKVFHIEERFLDVFSIIIFITSVVGLVFIIRENKEKEKEPAKLLLIITFIGGATFHFFLWETKAIYVIQYYFLLLPYAAIGLDKIFELIENRRQNGKQRVNKGKEK